MFQVLSVAAIALIGVIATVALALGLLNWFGGFYVVHCSRCHHLTGSSSKDPQESCVHCRHPALLHPIYAALHRAAPVRVLPDPLRY